MRTNYPKTYTSAEQVVSYLSDRIITDTRTYQEIAIGIGVSKSTINNIASGKTRWPRPATFFGLIVFYNIKMRLE